jgi:streptogramin lyase
MVADLMKFYRQWFVLPLLFGLFFGFFPGQVRADDMFSYWDIALANRFIKEIQESKNYIWIGTAKGLVRYDKRSKNMQTYTAANGLPDDFVAGIAIDANEDNVWIATLGGLAQLDINKGKINTFTKKNSKLSDNRVNAIYLFKNLLFVGTSFGIDIFNITTNQWKAYTSIEGLAGANIQHISSDGSSVWAGGADGISNYDLNEDAWYGYGVDNGLNSPLVTSLVVNSDVVWVGTMGGVSRFDRSTLRFDPYTTEEGLIDDSVQDLMDDGKYLWVGTFGGLSRLEKSSLVFTNFDARKGLTEASVTAGHVQGDTLYCGTDGGGIFTLNKSIPEISILSGRTGYAKKGEIEIYASILSKESIKSVNAYYKLIATADEFDYANVTTPGKWTEIKGVSSAKSESTRLAVLQTKDWPDGKYLIKAEIEDAKGNSNEATGIIIVDNKPPSLDVIFRPPAEGEKAAVVSGSYKELNLTRFEVKIGNKTVIPEINRQTRRFHFNYPLDSPDKIYITVEDIGKNIYSVVREFIDDRDPPQIELDPVDIGKIKSNLVEITGKVKEANIDKVIVLPDNVVAELTPAGADKYTFKAKTQVKKEGKYVYQITANDKMGNSSVKTLEIDFVSKISIVDVHKDKIPGFTLKDSFELSGNLLGPPLKGFYLLDKSRDRKYDLTIKKDKSFNSTIPLKEGDNEFILTKIFSDDHKEEDVFKISSSAGKVKAALNLVTNSFKDKLVNLRGSFDRGVKKVFIDNKPVKLNDGDFSFTEETILKDGKNTLTLSWLDELNRLEKKEYTLYLDSQPPVMHVRSLPDKTSMQTIRVRGTVSDNIAASISGYPGVEIQKIDPQTGEFEAIVKLEKGVNNVHFTALDPAGNKKEVLFHVDMDKSYPEKEVKDDALSSEVEYLRDELEKLRRELKNRPTVVANVQGDISLMRVNLPATPGLFFVPMAGKVKSFSLTAKVYLGNESLGDVLAQYNNKNPQELTRVLVPSPQMFSLVSNSKFRGETEKIIRSVAGAFHDRADAQYIRKYILQYLIRAKIFKEEIEVDGNTIFITNYGAGIVVFGNGSYNGAKLKSTAGLEELLTADVGAAGVKFQRY